MWRCKGASTVYKEKEQHIDHWEHAFGMEFFSKENIDKAYHLVDEHISDLCMKWNYTPKRCR